MNRSWRFTLLIVALILMLWPDIFSYANWVAILAVVLLLIDEFNCNKCCSNKTMKKTAPKKAMKKKKKRK